MDLSQYNQPSPDINEGVPEKIESNPELFECKTRIMKIFVSLLKTTSSDTLDVGPAGGWETIYLKNCCSKVTAITIFQEEVERLKKITESLKMDMHSLSNTWNNKFDAVFASHVLEHSHSPYIVLTEFYRVLKKGGVLFIVLPNADGYTGLHREKPTRIGSMKSHIFMPSIDTMIEMAKHAGFIFESYQEEPQTCNGMVHYLNRIFVFRR